jgi:hypothetical protein
LHIAERQAWVNEWWQGCPWKALTWPPGLWVMVQTWPVTIILILSRHPRHSCNWTPPS